MTSRDTEIAVIGAGVCGLSTAVCLAEAGLRVAVHADLPPSRTTSAAAGALWGTHLAGSDPRVAGWAAVTMRHLRGLAAEPAAGVRIASGRTASRQYRPEPPGFTAGAGPVTRCRPEDVPGGYSCWRYAAPLVGMPVYLGYLADRLRQAGGEITTGRRFASLAEAEGEVPADVIVNCSGIGARELVPDPGVVPVRGQVVVVANPGIAEFFVGGDEAEQITCFFPHASTVVLGGTHQHGNASTEPDPATAERIRRDCAAIEPSLRDAPVLAHLAGLRPVRAAVRLEADATAEGRLLVHNYGHGGAGVTMSWGCAVEVTELVRSRASAG